MTRTRVILMALLIGVTPLSAATTALASPNPAFAVMASLSDDQRPDRNRGEDRRERREERRSQGPSASSGISAGDAARRVASGREGRMLGIRSAGDGYVVRWEYPGGRVADIRVDGSGRVS